MGRSDEAPIRVLHDHVDAQAAAVAAQHPGRLQCRRGCSACCVDDLTVFEVEAARIRRAHVELLQAGEPHAPGACAFLDADGACRIYADRPYVCRTQGLPLRWFDVDASGQVVEQRDICPKNEAGPPLETLPDDACWLLGTTEQQLAGLESAQRDGAAQRVHLRALFRRSREERSGA